MADSDGIERPLSPHATIYRWPLNAVMSIMHRITGVGLVVGAALAVWWLLAASLSDEYFPLVDAILSSVPGDLVMTASLVALWYHFCNGIRHLVWDVGYGFDESSVRASGLAGLAATATLTVASLLVIQM